MSSETPSPLREAREALGLRLVDVSDISGKSTGLISMVENGYVPSKATRKALAKAVNKEPVDFWPEEKVPE